MAVVSAAPPAAAATLTPIQHLVVIFQENASFDHYFATYPKAKNPPGEPVFTAAPNTPSVERTHRRAAFRQSQRS
jgi:phospholipase C